jgi:hypothetical protein
MQPGFDDPTRRRFEQAMETAEKYGLVANINTR